MLLTTKTLFILLICYKIKLQSISSEIGDWHPLEFYLDFSLIEETSETKEKIQFFKDYLLQMSTILVKELLKVREKGDIQTTNTSCPEALERTTVAYNSEGLKKDYYLFVNIENEDNGTLGYALNCHRNPATKRPDTGLFVMNLFTVKNFNDQITYQYFLTVIHELFHALGFSSSEIFYFVDSNLSTTPMSSIMYNKDNFKYIKSNNVMRIATQHFNCNSMSGIRFENNGGNGSANHHWEKVDLNNEFMIARDSLGLKISDFTLAFFEDSGWYQVNYAYSQKVDWGNGVGCGFVGSCDASKFEEFCKSGTKCSNDFLNPVKCALDLESDDCTIKNKELGFCIYEKQYDSLNTEKYSYSNRCFEYSGGAGCYKNECNDNGKSIIFYVNGSKAQCKKDGEIITIEKKSFTCPNIRKFCEYRYECKESCFGRGTCYNGNCICFKGYKGVACEYESKNIIDETCNLNCSNNGKCNKGNCECFDNYTGKYCETIINDLGPFSSTCKNSLYIKCHTKLPDELLALSNYISLIILIIKVLVILIY